jgi:hypothetical protein
VTVALSRAAAESGHSPSVTRVGRAGSASPTGRPGARDRAGSGEARRDRVGGRAAVSHGHEGGRAGRRPRLALQRPWIVHPVHAECEVLALVVRERQAVRVGGPGDGGRQLRDAGDRREHVGELVVRRLVEVVQEDVGDPGPVGHVGEGPPVRRPLRVDVASFLAGQHLDGARGQVVERHAQGGEFQPGEVGFRAAIGDERDGPAVGRPGRLEVGVRVAREPLEVGPVGVHHEQVAEPAVITREHDAGRRRPGRRRGPVQGI